MRPSLHGFWGKGTANDRATPPDQGGLSDVLIVWDPTSFYDDAGVGSAYNRYHALDEAPIDMIPNIIPRENAAGYTVTVLTSYYAFLQEDLSKYAHIWDIPFATNIPDSVRLKYISYLQAGGAVFLLGEHAGFGSRNNDICYLINSAGDGGVGVGNSQVGTVAETMADEFLLANSNTQVTFYSPGVFTSTGNGTSMITSGYISAAMWKTGSLTNALKGAIVAVLDIDFLSDYLQPDFIDNIAICLNKK
jgi:hypothetical protein